MPIMTGMQLASHVNLIRDDIPIVLTSGMTDVIPKSQTEKMGVKQFVRKPFTRSEISNAIRLALNHKSA